MNRERNPFTGRPFTTGQDNQEPLSLVERGTLPTSAGDLSTGVNEMEFKKNANGHMIHPNTGEVMDDLYWQKRAEKEVAIMNSVCDQRAGKLIALLEAVDELCDEILDAKNDCDCAWHQDWRKYEAERKGDRDSVNLRAHFYHDVRAIGGSCRIFLQAIRSDEPTTHEYRVVEDCVEPVKPSWWPNIEKSDVAETLLEHASAVE